MYNIIFTNTRHGKEEHDGAGACVKRELAREELNFNDGVKFTGAENNVDWCVKNIRHESQESSMVRIYFLLIEEQYLEGYEYCMTLVGSSDMHSFRSSNASS